MRVNNRLQKNQFFSTISIISIIFMTFSCSHLKTVSENIPQDEHLKKSNIYLKDNSIEASNKINQNTNIEAIDVDVEAEEEKIIITEDLQNNDTLVDQEIPDDLGEPTEVAEAIEEIKTQEKEAISMADSTFPLIRNEFVDQWISYFTNGRGRKHFKRYLERKERFKPFILKTLNEYKLPHELLYLAMIESGFNEIATSWVGAKGVWQFMPATGRRYGLKVGYWIDERRDFFKATKAACEYLNDLHNIFGSWYLAAAGYNAGEGKILRAIRKHGTRNFWEIRRQRRAIRKETKNYVPKLIAAALISQNPEEYGFTDLNPLKPYRYENIDVPAGVSLKEISHLTGSNLKELKKMNSELRVGITPPGKKKYTLRIEPEHHEILAAKAHTLKSKSNGSIIYHRIRRGETLYGLARNYRSHVRAIMEMNSLKSSRRIYPGKKLAIPINLSKKARRYQASKKKRHKGPIKKGNRYLVQRGDSLWSIAVKNNVSLTQLKRLNRIRSKRGLQAGKWITLPGQKFKQRSISKAPSSKKASKESPFQAKSLTRYKVRRGDTLWSIALKHKTSIKKLKTLNALSRARSLKAGMVLKVAKNSL